MLKWYLADLNLFFFYFEQPMGLLSSIINEVSLFGYIYKPNISKEAIKEATKYFI